MMLCWNPCNSNSTKLSWIFSIFLWCRMRQKMSQCPSWFHIQNQKIQKIWTPLECSQDQVLFPGLLRNRTGIHGPAATLMKDHWQRHVFFVTFDLSNVLLIFRGEVTHYAVLFNETSFCWRRHGNALMRSWLQNRFSYLWLYPPSCWWFWYLWYFVECVCFPVFSRFIYFLLNSAVSVMVLQRYCKD